ncbi:PH domain-containing protein [Patescibacteria group bacterium]
MKDLKKITFPGRRPDEVVHLLLRRHWSVLLAHGIVSLTLLGVPLFAGGIVLAFIPSIADNSFYPLLVLAFWLYIMFVWTYFFVGWIDYYLDVWIVTNDRIINIEQNGLFNRIISEHKLYRIQDVTAEVSGVFRTFFNFGNVYIQTAAEMQRFAFEQIPEPYKVKKIVLQLHDIALQKEYERQAIVEARVSQQYVESELKTAKLDKAHAVGRPTEYHKYRNEPPKTRERGDVGALGKHPDRVREFESRPKDELG